MSLLRHKNNLILAALALAAAMLLAACGGGNGSSNEASASSAEVGASAESEGTAEAAGASFDYQAPKTYSATEQIPILNAAIATHPDVLVVSPDDPNALIAPL